MEGMTVEGGGPVAGRLSQRNRIVLVVLLVLLALAGTFVLYREAADLPFFFDDMVHLRWLDWHSLPEVWSTAEGLGYYRPLTMSAWKIGDLLLGYHDPRVFHVLNLLLHVLNTVLAGYFAWRAYRGRGRYAFVLLAAMLFLTFPFSYQAVPSTSSLSKPLIASLILGSAALYWEARRRHFRWLMAFSLLLAFLAPFAYETGVMAPLAVLVVEVLGTVRGEFERWSWAPILHMVLSWGVALPIVVLMEPETGTSLGLPSALNLWQNAVYFAQGLVVPIAPLATPLERVLPVDRYLLLGIVNLVGLVALWVFYRWARQGALFWYALSWFVVGVLPLWLVLDFRYVITSPRLLYLGGLGGAMLWGGIPVLLWYRQPARWWARVVAAIGAVGMLVFNVGYVRHKMGLANAVAAPVWQAVEAAKDQGAGATLLYLNVPAWIAPKEPVYRVGTEGLTFIPEYVRVQDSVYVNSGVEPEIRAYNFDPVKQDWEAYIGYAGPSLNGEQLVGEIQQVDGVYLMAYGDDELRFVEAGAREGSAGAREGSAGAPGEKGSLARFGDGIVLTKREAELSGSELRVTLWWQATQAPEGNLTVFLHVYDSAGQLVAQRDGHPLAGLFPAWMWGAGDRVRDVRHIPLPEEMASGTYTVAVGWYNADNGQRLPAVDGQGQPVEQDAVRIYEFNRENDGGKP